MKFGVYLDLGRNGGFHAWWNEKAFRRFFATKPYVRSEKEIWRFPMKLAGVYGPTIITEPKYAVYWDGRRLTVNFWRFCFFGGRRLIAVRPTLK